jgi:hypothetical protein
VKRPALLGMGLVLATLAGACASVLGIRPAPSGSFPHRAHVVHGTSCLECHAGILSEMPKGPVHLPTPSRCLTCHEHPHDRRDCLMCHSEPSTRIRAAANHEHLDFSHERHVRITHGDCVRCHVGVREQGGSLTAPMATCLSCHGHERAFVVRRCDGCHENLERDTAPPESHLIHDAGFLTRHGIQAASSRDLCATCHDQSFCARCHGVTVPALPSRLQFDDVTSRTMHRAGFLARHGEESRDEPGLCSTCHSEQYCIDCHLRQGVHASTRDAANPHPRDWVGALADANRHGRAARLDPASCASCHGGGGEHLCVRCHRVGAIGGNPHPPGWSSTKPRSDLPCRMCHRP